MASLPLPIATVGDIAAATVVVITVATVVVIIAAVQAVLVIVTSLSTQELVAYVMVQEPAITVEAKDG